MTTNLQLWNYPCPIRFSIVISGFLLHMLIFIFQIFMSLYRHSDVTRMIKLWLLFNPVFRRGLLLALILSTSFGGLEVFIALVNRNQPSNFGFWTYDFSHRYFFFITAGSS